MEDIQSKRRAKEALMFKLKGIRTDSAIRTDPNMAPQQQYQPQYHPQPQVQPQLQPQMPMKVDTQQDFRKMPYEGKAKYDNELKALNALKNETEERSQRPKKMFFEHYDTEEPYCPVIQNNSNPSGRPPNIPPEMYEGIVVKPKRPWVYLGTENLPPVEYQEINESSFKQLARKNMDPNAKVELNRKAAQNPTPTASIPIRNMPSPKPQKKGSKKADMESELSDLDMSDEIPDEEGESIFGSQYGPDTLNKNSENRRSRISNMKNSESFLGDDYSMSEGTETRNKHAEIFGSEGSEDEEDSEMFKKKKTNLPVSKSTRKKQKDDEFSDD